MIVKADTVSRSQTERGVLRVRRPYQQRAETLTTHRILMQIQLQLRHPLLGKTDGAFVPVMRYDSPILRPQATREASITPSAPLAKRTIACA